MRKETGNVTARKTVRGEGRNRPVLLDRARRQPRDGLTGPRHRSALEDTPLPHTRALRQPASVGVLGGIVKRPCTTGSL